MYFLDIHELVTVWRFALVVYWKLLAVIFLWLINQDMVASKWYGFWDFIPKIIFLIIVDIFFVLHTLFLRYLLFIGNKLVVVWFYRELRLGSISIYGYLFDFSGLSSHIRDSPQRIILNGNISVSLDLYSQKILQVVNNCFFIKEISTDMLVKFV